MQFVQSFGLLPAVASMMPHPPPLSLFSVQYPKAKLLLRRSPVISVFTPSRIRVNHEEEDQRMDKLTKSLK